MKDDYIRRQDVVDTINTNADGLEQNGGIPYAQGARAMAIVVEQMLPADVASVVHCRDCARLNRNGYCTRFQNNISGIATSWFMPDDDDFCSYGEHREG